MTEVVNFKCKACGKQFGTIGMHGYNLKEGNGELPVVCKKCQNIQVAQYKDHKPVRPACYKCKLVLVPLDGKCPKCGSDQLVFSNVRLPGMEMKASAVTP